MSDTKWETTKQAGIPCPVCGKAGTCTTSPDHTAFKCWRDGGKVHQTNQKPKAVPMHNGKGQHAKPKVKKGKGFATPVAAIEAAWESVGCCVLARESIYPGDRMRVLRFDMLGDQKGEKEYRPIHQAGGKWFIGDPEGPLPLYKGDDAPGPILFVGEGEKAADAIRSLDLPAVTSAHGSAAPEKSDWTPAKGRQCVVIFPDNDLAGAKYAAAVARIIFQLDPSAKIKIVNLPGLPDGGDMVEFIEAGGTRDKVMELVEAAPYLRRSDYVGGPMLVCMATVAPVDVAWFWPGKIPIGSITVLGGRPGCGKSFATCCFAAIVSRGTSWPDGTPCPKGTVIIISAEDDPGTIRRRLDGEGADCRRIHLLKMVKHIGEGGRMCEVMFTLADVAALESAMQQAGDGPLFIIIDPIGSYMGGRVDAHRDNEVRAVLAPVAALAEKYGAAVLIIAHYRKSAGASADDMMLGSRAFTGIARSVLHLVKDPQDKKRRLLLPGKCNLAPEGDGLAFSIMGDPPVLAWEPEPVTMTADEALVESDGPGRGRPADSRREAEEWLRIELGDYAEHPVKDIEAAAEGAGLKWMTVRRASMRLKVISGRATFGGDYTWRLPKPAGHHAVQCEQQGACEQQGEYRTARENTAGNEGHAVPNGLAVPKSSSPACAGASDGMEQGVIL